jgi:cob(I)alamin adenosyltransferase
MRIYTRTGDAGQTGLFDGTRVAKDDVRIEAFGQIDELNSVLGLLRCEPLAPPTEAELVRIQNDLFAIGSDLATPGGRKSEAMLDGRIRDHERLMDEHTAALPPLKAFILPGGSREAALCHLGRAVCRRAERVCWAMHRQHPISPKILIYLNRLSDLLFTLARAGNARAGLPDVEWKG